MIAVYCLKQKDTFSFLVDIPCYINSHIREITANTSDIARNVIARIAVDVRIAEVGGTNQNVPYPLLF